MKTILTLDMGMQSLEFAQLVPNLVLVQYFLTMLPSLHCGIVMYALSHYMFEVGGRLFHFDFFFFSAY